MSITDKLSLVENNYNEIVEKLNNGNIKDNRAIQELMKKKSEIEDIVFEYKKLKEILKSYKIELIVLAGFMSVLSKNFVKDYPKKIINIHPSLIPSFCGKNFYGIKVHEEAIKRGVKITGATTHFVNEIIDGGEIIMQKSVKVLDNDTAEKLQKRVMESAEWIILPKTVEKVCKSLIL